MGKGKTQSRPKRSVEAGLPVTLQALRERAGLGMADGAGADLREFFADAKFSGDPDRPTAIAMVAVDAIIRDPSMLDATTCFGEGQIDTAVGAARLVLGERNLDELCEIRGESDLELLAQKCRVMAGDRDVKAGCMAARHLWGMCNTVLRTFPSSLFRNGACDDFQTALLAVAGRHLGIFNPDSGDTQVDFSVMVARAERIAELGGEGKYHPAPASEKEASETVMHMAKMGKFSELRDSSIVDMVSPGGPPSTRVAKLLGLKKVTNKARSKVKEGSDWIEETALTGNGAFFAGRTYEEVKARYPGYPGHSTENSYWDSCTRHPATHGICCRLYSKVPLLTRVGGVEEGLSRAVTNKLVHHNTKFSRLSLWVKLSNGKGFWVHRTRPINWASHGVTESPFASEGGQLELFGSAARGKAKNKKVDGDVTVEGFELKAMNYSHMPWVNKAISQYVEEAPFISTPSDEHQTCLSILSKSLREGGVPYREAVEKAADIYSLLPGRGRAAGEVLSREIGRLVSRGELAGECEGALAEALRSGELLARTSKGGRDVKMDVAGSAMDLASSSLQKGIALLENIGVSPAKAREATTLLSGLYPVQGSRDAGELRKVLGKLTERVPDRDLLTFAAEVTGLASRCTKEAFSLSDQEVSEIAGLVGDVLGAGVLERGKVSSPGKGEETRSMTAYSDRLVEMAVSRGLTVSQASDLALKTLEDAVDVAAEIEIRMAQSGATLGDKDRGTLFSYCAKHAKANPLSSQDMHNRIASYGGGLTVSLDAPVGDDGKDDLYSVFSSGADHDPEEEAFGGGEIPHWLDVEKNRGADSSRPGFMPDGGDELFSSFGMDAMAEDLYRVVSTKGDIEQKDLLEQFASLNVESIATRGGALAAKEQVSAMLDLLDKEDELPVGEASTRRRALTWIFQSVLASVGEDREGFQKLGGIGGEKLREALFDKIRRHGMPGVLIREGEPTANQDLGGELDKLKSWGYSRVGVSLPQESAGDFSKWAEGGGVMPLLEGIRKLGGDEVTKIKEAFGGMVDGAVGAAASAFLGDDDRRREEGAKYLLSKPSSEGIITVALAAGDGHLWRRLSVARMAGERGMQVDFLGQGVERAADAARLDSILMVPEGEARAIARRLGEFGISSRVVKGGVDGVVGAHPDYGILPEGEAVDRQTHLLRSRVPLPKRLVLAAISAHETGVKK